MHIFATCLAQIKTNPTRFKEDHMRSLRLSGAAFIGSLLTALLLATFVFSPAAMAKAGRDFSGHFDVSGVQEQGDLVQLTLHLKLYNHGDEDARSVVVALMSSSPAPMLYGSFTPVKVWKSHDFIEMSQQFSVSKREYNEWMQTPVQPNLTILFQDSQGKTWQVGAQVSQRRLVHASE